MSDSVKQDIFDLTTHSKSSKPGLGVFQGHMVGRGGKNYYSILRNSLGQALSQLPFQVHALLRSLQVVLVPVQDWAEAIQVQPTLQCQTGCPIALIRGTDRKKA